MGEQGEGGGDYKRVEWEDFGKAAEAPSDKSASSKGAAGGFEHIYGPEVAAPLTGREREELADEAQDIIEKARIEAESLRETARSEGLAEGLKQGRAELTDAIERLGRLAVELAAFKPKLFEEASGQAFSLTIAIVERVLGPIAASDRTYVMRVIERALHSLSERETVTVRLNPDDLQLIMESKAEVQGAVDGIKNITFIDDPSVGRGGCMVETEASEIDARLPAQLDEIIRALKAVS